MKCIACFIVTDIAVLVVSVFQQSAKLFYEDRVFLYGKQSRIDRAVETCKNVKWKAATEK